MSEPSNAGTPASEGLGKELDKAAAAPPAAAKAPPAKPAAAAPPKPPAAAAAPPKKPAAPAKGKQTRRGFLSALTEPINVAWMAFAGSIGLSSLGLLRFMLPNVLAEPPSEFKIGPLDPFRAEPDTVNERWKNEFGVWIVNLAEEKKLVALSTTCTHLGCVPSWLPTDRKFKCPCHGSGFYMTGVNFEGPAPRPLERFSISEIDGVLVVNKAKKFQAELGQWTDPESFIRL